MSGALWLALGAALISAPPAAPSSSKRTAKAVAGKPALVAQTGHTQEVFALAFSDDESLLASGSFDGAIHIWDLAAGKELRALPGHATSVNALFFRPRTRELVSCATDSLSFWDVDSGARTFHLPGPCIGGGASRDGREILIGGAGVWVLDPAAKKIRGIDSSFSSPATDDWWKAVDEKTVHMYGAIAVSRDSSLVAGGDFDSDRVEVYSIRGRATKPLWSSAPRPSRRARSVAFSPDGKTLAAGDDTGEVRIFDAKSGKLLETLAADALVSSLAFSPDGKTLAAGGKTADKRETLRLWRMEKKTSRADSPRAPLPALDRSTDDVLAIAWSPSGRVLATAGGRQLVRRYRPRQLVAAAAPITLWDASPLRRIRQLSGVALGIASLAFTPDGRFLAAGTARNEVVVWELERARLVESFDYGHMTSVSALEATPDGRVISGGLDKSIIVWDLAKKTEQDVLLGHANVVTTMSVSPDGRFLASGSLDTTIRIWDLASGEERRLITAHKGFVKRVAFSPDGAQLASSATDDTLRFWDTSDLGSSTATTVRMSSGFQMRGMIDSIAYSPDMKLIAIGDSALVVLERETWKQLDLIPGASGSDNERHRIVQIVFHPDGKRVIAARSALVGATGGEVWIWDASLPGSVRTIPVKGRGIAALALHPDGKRVAVATLDATIRLIDLERGAEVISLIAISGGESVATTPDGHYTASRGALRGVAFRIGRRAHPFEQLDLKLNRPDLVLERLGSTDRVLIDAYRRAREKRLLRAGFTEESLVERFDMPEIEIATKVIPISTRERKLPLEIVARSPKADLDRLAVYVNDVPIAGSAGISLRKKKTRRTREKVTVELSAGLNKVQLSALDVNGVESLKSTFEITLEGPEPRRDLYVLAIGVSDYAGEELDLRYAAKDADDLVGLFESRRDRFRRVVGMRVLDGHATREQILAMREVLRGSKVDDEVIVFFAGHGVLDGERDYYFATSDVDFTKPSARGLKYEEMESLLDGIPARRKLLLIDSCHSGEVDPDASPSAPSLAPGVVSRAVRPVSSSRGVVSKASPKLPIGVLLGELFADLRRGSGATVISSSSGLELAYESGEWKNGVFTYALLEALKKRGPRVSELREEVLSRVRELTGGLQTPTSRRENLEDDFPIY